MKEKILIFLVVFLTVIIMGIFSYKTFKKENHCSKCKKNKDKKI